jgi:hypothetical protein
MASGLIACTITCYICVIIMQSRNQVVVPPIFSSENFAGTYLGKTKKNRSSDCFSVMALLGLLLLCI